jgi:transcription initiation factor TFIIIB Brf1 subunit/transcription initiation factor TFIIB
MISKLPIDSTIVTEDSFSQDDCENFSVHEFRFDEIRGEKTCVKCGLVLEISCVSMSLSIPRHFNEDSGQHGAGYKEFTPIENVAARQTLDPKNSECNPALSRALTIMNKMPWFERKVVIGLNQIKLICAEHNYSEMIKQRAIFLFRQAIKQSVFRGSYIDLIAISCILYASKSAQIPFNWQIIVKNLEYSENLTLKYYYKLTLCLRLPQIAPDPKLLIRSFCAELHLPNEIVGQAFQLVLLFSQNSNTSGLEPKGIAAGSIYFACILSSFHRSQKDIASLCHVSELTLRSRLKEIQNIYHQKGLDSHTNSLDNAF